MHSCPNCNAELDIDALATVRCPVCNTLLDPNFVSGREARERAREPVEPQPAAPVKKPAIPDPNLPIKRSLRMRLRKLVDWSHREPEPEKPVAKSWDVADPIQEMIEDQATAPQAAPVEDSLPIELPDVAAEQKSPEEAVDAEFDVEFLDDPKLTGASEVESPELSAEPVIKPAVESENAPRELTASDQTAAFLQFPPSAEDPTAAADPTARTPQDLSDEDFDIEFLDESPAEPVVEAAVEPAAELIADASADSIEEPRLEEALSPDADDSKPGAPRTITESDFTIAFTEGSAPLGDLPISDDAAQSAGPRALTDSDFTIAFVDEPKTSADAAPVDEATKPRELTDSDYTMAFVEGSTPLADLPPATDDGKDKSQRTLTDSDYTIAFDDTPKSPASASPSAPDAAPRELTDSDYTMAFVEGSSPVLPPVDDSRKTRQVTESDHTMAFVEGSAQAAELAAAAAAAAAKKTRDTNAAGMTIDLSEVPAERMDMITGIWDSVPPSARPGMTIKAASPEAVSQTHLVVRPRLLHSKEKPLTDGADYELLETIGQGGMGVVYAARQASIDRTVAIKMIRGDMAADADQRQKFLSEAVVTGDLDHPNIVPIYDLGSNDGGALFYSMKRVEGTPWMKVIRQKTLEENLDILMKVADAVAFAHSRGVVHRDLKPENVMLGDFGEVLVMDWGLALLAPRFRHLGSISQSGGMGGTPAYMAPEMASGPIERIGMPADIYLLGAILYEILTGKPPHAGKDVMSCLYAVARNDIEPTDKTGELMDIARKAMATEIQNRYESVQDFQAAIRLYHSHAQSILLAARAEEDLVEAEKSRDYQDFARSVFGFQEALELWAENERAREKLTVAKLAYASCAMTKGDLDLADSLLDADEPSFANLREQVTVAKRERNARQARLRFFVNAARALVAAVVLISTVAFFAVRHQRNNALLAEAEAVNQRNIADNQRDIAEENKNKAEQEEQKAVAQKEIAEQQRQKAIEAENVAVKAKDAEEALREQKEYEAYIAQIGLVAAKIDENAFGYAAQLLDDCTPELRHWEWGRLMRLCRQSSQTLLEDGPINGASFSPNGKRVLTGSRDGKARVWDLATGQVLATLDHGAVIYSVGYSPDGHTIATGGDADDGEAKLWDAESGALLKKFGGHSEPVLSVAFSHDGRKLLTASYDKTARLWDIASGAELREFKGHSWWVWSAAFSPDDAQIVTASQDGTAIVWSADSASHSAPFTGHAGPIYCAAFSPDGNFVATCGEDRKILLWRPDQLREFTLKARVEEPSAAKAALQTASTPFVGHSSAVRSVRFSPDGAMLLSGSHDNTVKLWQVDKAACVGTLRGHAGWVRSCGFSSDGKLILSAGFDHQAKVWNIDEYEEVRMLAGHTDVVLASSFSPDGKQVVTASRDRTARIWDADTGRELKRLDEGHLFLVTSAGFSHDGKRILTGAGDATVRVWDAATGGELLKFDHTGRNGLFALSPDGTRLLTGGGERTAQYWDAVSGERLFELAGHRSDVTAVAISPDGKTLYTGDVKGHGKLWDAASGRELFGLEGSVRKITAAAFLPGGKRLLTASHDHVVAQWDVATGKELTDKVLRHPKGVGAMAISTTGAYCVTACDDGRLRVWKVDPPQVVREIGLAGFSIQTLAIAPNGKHAICACSDNKIRLWDLSTGAQMANPVTNESQDSFLDVGKGTVWSAAISPDGSQILTAGGNDAKLWQLSNGKQVQAYSPHGAVASAGFSPDGKRVATGSWDGTVKLWNTETAKADLKFVASKNEYVHSVVFSSDGAKLLTGSDDATAKIWDAKTGELVMSFPAGGAKDGHTDSVRSAQFSTDGKRIITASADKTAKIWDADTGACVMTLAGHNWELRSAVFSKDGKRVITASDDKTARIWDAETGKQLLELPGHTASVTAVAFTPDGARVATGSDDNAVKLWDAVTGKEILHLKQHSKEITSVTFSPDGKSLLTSGRDGRAIIWPAVDWH